MTSYTYRIKNAKQRDKHVKLRLDCTENWGHLRLAFFPWVPCTVHGTRKYRIKNFFFLTESHGTIHTFKNYFVTVFSIISFQFLTISDIQTDRQIQNGSSLINLGENLNLKISIGNWYQLHVARATCKAQAM